MSPMEQHKYNSKMGSLDERTEHKQLKLKEIENKIGQLKAQLNGTNDSSTFMDPAALFEQKEE